MNTIRRSCLALLLPALAACGGSDSGADAPGNGAIAFTGATVWDGTAADPIADATIVVRDGRIESVEAGGDVPRGAEEVDLSGRYVVPGLIDAHAHVSGHWAEDGVQGDGARVEEDLRLFARYGVTTVNSLGGEPAGADALRDAQQRAAPGRARVYVAGTVITGPTPAEAEEQVISNADRQVDWIKLRVDDNLGTAEKMAWPTIEAAIRAAHSRGLRVATHLFYFEDAQRLMDIGTDLIAHSVRDTTVTEAFALRLRQEGVCYVPTLTREITTFAYAERPEWFDDPFFQRWAKTSEVATVTDPAFQSRMAESPAAARYREALGQAQTNLAVLAEAGAPIAFGTDAGPATRFPGYLEHLELELMVEAGLTPRAALESATRGAASCLGLADVGVLEPGRWADFLVLDEDPLVDIRATRTLRDVYVGGGRVE